MLTRKSFLQVMGALTAPASKPLELANESFHVTLVARRLA